MLMRAHTTWLSGAEKTLVVDEALTLLERVGMRMKGARALEALAAAGADVDAATGMVRFPPALVREAVALCPRDVLMGGATPADDVLFADDEPSHFCSSGCGAFVLDDETGERRLSTLDDLCKATALLDAASEVDVIWTTVTANDVPLEVRELVGYHAVLTQSDKHVTFVDCPSQVEPLLRIAEIVAGHADAFRERPRFSTLITAASPLTVDGAKLDFHTAVAAAGVPVQVYTVPMAGATAPVTVAGGITLSVAEFLGVATAIQSLAPGARLIFGASGSIMDMRSAGISYASPESSLMATACVEVGHLLGVPVAVAGMATEAKHPGIQAGYEKALRGLSACAAGADVLSGGVGMLDSVNTLYLPQIVIDNEIAGLIRRLLGDVTVSHEEILGEMVEKVGVGGHFLAEKETRRRIRAGEHFAPAISTRASYDAWAAEGRDELTVARELTAESLAARADWRPALSDEQLAALAAVCGVQAG
jgi:trimethylamine--corrinoid protein Co-methyltransferase